MKSRGILMAILLVVFLTGMAVSAAEPVKIVYKAHTLNQAQLDIYTRAAQSFKEKTGIEVEIITSSNHYEVLQTMVVSGADVDASFIADWLIPEYVKKGILLDVQPIAARDKNWNESDFFPVTIDQTLYEGGRYGVPRHFSPMLMYINRTAFSNAGLADPPSNWTWDEFKEIAKRLTIWDEKGQAQQWGFWNLQQHDFSGNALALPIIRSFGGDLFSPDCQDLVLATPISANAMQWLIDLSNVDHVAPVHGDLKKEMNFQAGKSAMHLYIYGLISELRNLNVSFDWDVAQIPTGVAGRINRAASGIHTVLTSSKNPEAAWEWIKFLAESEVQNEFMADGTGSALSVRKSVNLSFMNRSAASAMPPRNIHLYNVAAMEALPYPKTPYYTEAVNALRPALTEAWRGTKPFRSAILEVKDSVEAILRQK